MLKLQTCFRSVPFLLALLVAAFAEPLHAQATAVDDAPNVRRPFDDDAVGIEVGTGLFREAWDFNGNTESIAAVDVAPWWSVSEGYMVLLQLHGFRVFQQGVPNAFVKGVMPAVRIRLSDRGRWNPFVDVGVGLSWSDHPVPPGGTTFNYLAAAGGGMLAEWTTRLGLATGFRWLHLSNNGRNGARNPDTQALGGYVSFYVVLN